jgi:chromosome segregation ATPase
LALVSRRLVDIAQLRTHDAEDLYVNDIALLNAEASVDILKRRESDQNREIVFLHEDLRKARHERDHARRLIAARDEELQRLRAEYATFKHNAQQRRGTWAARAATYEAQLKEKSRLSANQGPVANEQATSYRWKMEAQATRNLLSYRTEQFDIRLHELSETAAADSHTLRRTRTRMITCEAQCELKVQELAGADREFQELEDDLLLQLNDARCSEITGKKRIQALTCGPRYEAEELVAGTEKQAKISHDISAPSTGQTHLQTGDEDDN